MDELKVSSPTSSPPPPVPAPSLNIPTSPSSVSVESANGWDIVDDLPLRWSTDFIPFPLSKDKMVSFYQLWSTSRTIYLAVVTRTNILLYETRKSERAFKFVKVCSNLQTAREPGGIEFWDRISTLLYRQRASRSSNKRIVQLSALLQNRVMNHLVISTVGDPHLPKGRIMESNPAYSSRSKRKLCVSIIFCLLLRHL